MKNTNKNIKVLTVITLILSSVLVFGQTEVTRYTPNGSPVRAYNNVQEMSLEDKTDWSALVKIYHPLATEINTPSATRSYNCHAYAWHVKEGGDAVWIGYYPGQEADEDIYWTDGSYYNLISEVNAEKISFYNGNHSAIQTATQGVYISKWGPGPLMQHSRDYGPSEYNMAYRNYYKRPRISGPTQLCTQETYTLDYIPTGATVVWSAVPSYLVSIEQSTGIVTKVYSGKITLTATITLNNHNTIISKENIFVGSPMGLVISNVLNLLDAGYSNYFKILPATGDYPYEGSLSLLDPAGATFNYEWSFSSSMPKKNIVYWWSDGNKVNVAAKTANAGAVLKCTATNNCGSSVSYYTFYTGNISQPPPPLFISPNPAVSEVNITLGESIVNTENIDTEYDISIYNNYGKPVYKYKTKSKNTKVNVSGWQKGLYIVKISNNNQMSEDKFFVQ